MNLIDYISANPYNYSGHISLTPINNNSQYVLSVCYAPDIFLSSLQETIHQTNPIICNIIFPILQMKKLRGKQKGHLLKVLG